MKRRVIVTFVIREDAIEKAPNVNEKPARIIQETDRYSDNNHTSKKLVQIGKESSVLMMIVSGCEAESQQKEDSLYRFLCSQNIK